MHLFCLSFFTSEILRLIDYYLQILVKVVPFYMRDTNDFVNKVNNVLVSKGSVLVSMDADFPHTEISNNECITPFWKWYG